MFFQRITTEGLSHHSYFVADALDALVIDPRRDIDVYLELARSQGVRIRHILETHRHEDFAVGSSELGDLTAAVIHHGTLCPFQYGTPIGDGEELSLGRLMLRALETPGHTDESMTYALVDTASGDTPVIAFTGDALFVGEVGRTDLYGPDARECLAATLYESLFDRILPLGDQVILAPAHGGGSVCGASILDRNESTLGYERRHNPKLALARKEFIRTKVRERLVIPRYFRRMEEYNLKGVPLLGRLPNPNPLSPGEFAKSIDNGALILDVRLPQAFAGGHIPGSTSIWLAGVPIYTGWVLPLDHPILLVADPEVSIERVVRMLVRIGYEHLAGYLKGGFESWQNQGRPLERTGVVTAPEVLAMLKKGATLVDVRNVEEWTDGIIEGSLLIDVAELEEKSNRIPRDGPVISMCSVGHRGSIGASILQRQGFRDVYNFLGGMTAWRRWGYPVVAGPQGEGISRITLIADTPAIDASD